MILNTNPCSRKEMVKAISEHTTLRSTYTGMPSGAYQIGTVTVNMDGTITCHDEKMIENIKPLLIARGWLDAKPGNSKESVDSGASDEDAVEPVGISVQIHDWTVTQMINLMRLLYSKQHLLNRMMQGDTFFISESFINAMTNTPPASADDLEARIQRAVDDEHIHGVAFKNGRFIFNIPSCADQPKQLKIYNVLFAGILKSAKTAVRVSIKQQVHHENEKYHANSWLMRMGFGGAQYKELRHTLMGHLNGYAAFKSTADMQAHRERQAARRLDLKAGVRSE